MMINKKDEQLFFDNMVDVRKLKHDKRLSLNAKKRAQLSIVPRNPSERLDLPTTRHTNGQESLKPNDRVTLESKTKNPSPHQLNIETIRNAPSDGFVSSLQGAIAELNYSTKINKSLFRKLRKGKIPYSRTLDLHSMSLQEAKLSVVQELSNARHQRDECVKIIHGKGVNSPCHAIARLKMNLNHWLPQIPFVRAYCSCTTQDGSTGAIYVLIRTPL